MKGIIAVYNILSNAAGLTALVGTNIYPAVLDQGATFPAVVVSAISNEAFTTHSGVSDVDQYRVQVDCIAQYYDQAADVNDQVRSALERTKGVKNGVTVLDITYESSNDNYNSETKYFQIVSEFFVMVKTS